MSSEQALNVLLIEDDPEDALLVREAFDHAADTTRLALQRADRLQAGLARLADGGIDVILLDLSLPDCQGFETFERTYAQAARLPIVVLTGSDDHELATRVVQSGAQDYLVKQELRDGFLCRTLRYAVERKRLEEQLRQSQKMEAIGRLAGGIAHDFNNLLTVILGYSDLMLSRVGANETLRRSVERIKQAGEQGAKLITQLLAFSSQQPAETWILDLNKVVGNMVRLLEPVIGDRITVAARLSPEAGRVRIGQGQLEQVIMNLAVNARDAMPDGGTLILETSQVRLDEVYALRHAGVKPGPHVALALSDTGIGMDDRTMSQLFEPFFTTKEKGRGTGLGLATVFQIVQQSEGHIRVYSEPGRGSTFKIFWPKVESSAEATAA
jgi:signal transduction histidine kinase